jgi:transposase InsO family protein
MVVGAPLECISLDLTGPHIPSSQGYRYLLTVIDHFSRWAEAYPVRNQEALTVAKVLMDQWIARFGCPLQILTDQGSCFEAALFQDLCRLLQIDKVRTSPYKPSTNGMIERFHRTLNSMIGKVIAENQRDWPTHIPTIMAAYRASKHESTGFTPNKLFLSREVCAPIDLVLGDCFVEKEDLNCHEYVYETGKRMQTAFALARECMQTQAETRAFRYDMRVRPKTFEIGQLVWYYYPRHRSMIKDKWASWYIGPFKIVDKIGPVLFKIKKSPRAQAKAVYIDKLKLYVGDVPDVWKERVTPDEPDMDLNLPLVTDTEIIDQPQLIDRPRRVIRPPVRFGFDD